MHRENRCAGAGSVARQNAVVIHSAQGIVHEDVHGLVLVGVGHRKEVVVDLDHPVHPDPAHDPLTAVVSGESTGTEARPLASGVSRNRSAGVAISTPW